MHLPAAAWAAYTEFSGTICPLTPLENALRQRAGDAGYAGGFVEHYLIPLIYPAGLTPSIQLGAGIARRRGQRDVLRAGLCAGRDARRQVVTSLRCACTLIRMPRPMNSDTSAVPP